jgi:glycosyltransferase involved in cell wall biosynthesis
MSSLIAILPAHNEAAHIAEVAGIARRFLPVLVVDDGSSDDTAHLAEDAGAEVLRQIPNQGKGAALRAGFRRALERGCDAAITLDADGQHDPLEIPRFLEAFQCGRADLIIGTRRFDQMPLSRRAANLSGRWLVNWALGRYIPDNQSGYRLVSRRLMEALLASDETGFEFEVEMIAACLKRGYNLDWVPVRTIYAGEKSHIRPLHHVIHFVRVVLKTRKMMAAT